MRIKWMVKVFNFYNSPTQLWDGLTGLKTLAELRTMARSNGWGIQFQYFPCVTA